MVKRNSGKGGKLATTRAMQRSSKRINTRIDRAGRRAKAAVGHAAKRVAVQEQKLRREAKVQMAKAQKNFSRAQHNVRQYIDKNPKKAAAIAASIGAALGAASIAALRRRR